MVSKSDFTKINWSLSNHSDREKNHFEVESLSVKMDLDLPYKIQRAGVEETNNKCSYCSMEFSADELVIAQMVQVW